MIYNGFKTGVLYGTTSGDRDAISRKYLIKYCNAKKCEYYARTESLWFIGVALKKRKKYPKRYAHTEIWRYRVRNVNK